MNYSHRPLARSWLVWAAAATGLLSIPVDPVSAQTTKLRLSTIKPGTEQVQLIHNGDFQFPGPLVGTNYPSPTGWSGSGNAEIGTGSNVVAYNNGVVLQAHTNNPSGVSRFNQTVTLEPATAYVCSGYLWNFGDATNHANVNVDLDDVAGDPQMTLVYTDTQADKGYFVYRSFNTSTTGTNLTLRLFYDGITGTGAALSNAPLVAQWDNLAITKAANFVAPQPSGSAATLRPQVRLISPVHGAFSYATGDPVTLSADATDLDGSITNVQFFVGTVSVGATSASPWTAVWSNVTAGSCMLTAVASDNTGATTRSAPITLTVATQAAPPALGIQATSGEVVLSWPGAGMMVQAGSNVVAPVAWRKVTNAVEHVNATNNVLTLAATAPEAFFRLAPEVDASTMTGKLLMGYQGWFACPGDGSASSKWFHWFRNFTPNSDATNATVDFWPDVSELDPDELFPTIMTYRNGTPARLYSAYNAKTVRRHFQWMHDYGLDGVFLQRFSSELSDAPAFARMNKVANNVRDGAEAYRRVFAMMYDISGQSPATLVSTLTNDWVFLANTLQITNNSRYLRHLGRPVVAIWGFGFTDRPGTPQQAQQVIAFFKNAGLTVMGGVPTSWRTLNNDSKTDPAWAAVYRSFDVISPWAVGRYSTPSGADTFRVNLIVPDRAEAAARGRDYMPVIFPGFSWHNLMAAPLNQIPRNGGSFYWRQAYNAKLSGCTMIYGAMFDEVDEGTAMFKLAPTTADVPAQGSWVPLNIDGFSLPSDWYLRLAGEASRMLRGDIPLQSTIPIVP
jgi:hypothetical protein